MWCWKMRLVAVVVVVFTLMAAQDGGRVAADLASFDPAQRRHATEVLPALRRRTTGELLVEDPNLCFSLRENEEQRQLLCNDHRSKFNFNPFGLRFGKRYIYRRAVKRARTNKFSPFSLFSRELEVPT